MFTKDQFLSSTASLIVFHGDEVAFESDDSDLRPLVAYLGQTELGRNDVTMFDRYVGRAAALLMSRIKPIKVNTGTISEGGAVVLDEHAIPFEAKEKVTYLMGVASQDMCRWEKMAVGKSSEEL
ncbi:MAG: DUF1893 domain-containing protein [candidate division Zixibacteria bacterium]|nr:DUF1893 domain-containing protein [candidate division Zixibacteria bacterium]